MSSVEIIGHIIKDICALSSSSLEPVLKDPAVVEILAAYTIRSAILDPENEFNTDNEFTKLQVDKLIKICVGKLTSNSVESQCIKMQVYFDTIYPLKDSLLAKEKVDNTRNLVEFKQNVMDFRGRTIPEMEAIYRKLVAYIMRLTKLGVDTDLKDIRECTAVLESVFPLSELKAFIGKEKVEKETLLGRWGQLVTGIRLFNKFLGKGGENVEDIYALCNQEIDALKNGINRILNRCASIIKGCEDKFDGNPAMIKNEQFEETKSTIVYFRQIELYVGYMNYDILNISAECDKLGLKFAEKLKDLRNACKSRTAVPVEQIYPIFTAVSLIWEAWRDHLSLLQFYTKVFDNLRLMAMKASDDNDVAQRADDEIVKDDVISKNAMEIASHLMTINPSVDIIHPGNFTQFKSVLPEYNGFCITSFCEGSGVVLAGNKSLGYLRYQDKLYSFKSSAGFYAFAKDPSSFIHDAIMITKSHSSLIELLQLYSYFPTIEALENTKSFGRQKLLKQKKVTSECGSQSEVHFIDSYFDPTYRWNEWDLRRKALELVNLKKKFTHSTQTQLSHFTRDSETQCFPQKSGNTQTVKSSSVKMEQVVTYMRHLRVDPQDKKEFEVVRLEVNGLKAGISK